MSDFNIHLERYESNTATRNAEIQNIEKWSYDKNLKLNSFKSTEIVFANRNENRDTLLNRQRFLT